MAYIYLNIYLNKCLFIYLFEYLFIYLYEVIYLFKFHALYDQIVIQYYKVKHEGLYCKLN